ncbi:hypothetical protein MPER_02117 [Moniliophthora perniciosa FA553]|nr:hypothetical protein MPER_02117 [Moniliophthora perniciosa FA553]
MKDLSVEKNKFVALWVETTFWGAYTVLFCICIYVLLYSKKAPGGTNKPLMATAIIMYLLCTAHVINDFARTHYRLYQLHRTKLVGKRIISEFGIEVMSLNSHYMPQNKHCRRRSLGKNDLIPVKFKAYIDQIYRLYIVQLYADIEQYGVILKQNLETRIIPR